MRAQGVVSSGQGGVKPTLGSQILDHPLCDEPGLRLLLGCGTATDQGALELAQGQQATCDDDEGDQHLDQADTVKPPQPGRAVTLKILAALEGHLGAFSVCASQLPARQLSTLG